MAGKTILVVDADQETVQKITTTLETEGYMVFTASSQAVTPELIDRLAPDLLYLKPLAPSAAGFEPCKAIHAIPSLNAVPIVLLASLKGSVDQRYTEIYGIVDFIRLTFSPEELIEKTRAVLQTASTDQFDEEYNFDDEDAFTHSEAPVSPQAEMKMPVEEPPPAAAVSQPVQEPPRKEPAGFVKQNPFEDEEPPVAVKKPLVEAPPRKPAPVKTEMSWHEEEKEEPPSPRPVSRPRPTRGRQKSPSLLPWLAGILIIAAVIGGGFAAYQFIPSVRETVQRFTGSVPPPVAKPAPAPPTPATTASPAPSVPAPAPVATPAPAATQTPAASQAPGPSVPPAQVASPPPPPAATTPPAKTAAAPPQKPVYYVQVGAFKSSDSALALVKTLKSKGYEAFSQQGVTKEKSPVFRVLVGKYQDRRAAENMAQELQAKEKIKTTIFTE